MCACECPDVVNPPTPMCRAICRPELAECGAAGEATMSEPAPAPAASEPEDEPADSPNSRAPDPDAQRRWFTRLITGQGLTPEVERMLIDDFAAMSDETRKYLIRTYRDGVN
jgi:hypothetical protein